MAKKGSEWTDEEIKILEECCQNFETINDIKIKLPNRTETAIQLKIQRLGLNKKYQNPRTWTLEEVEILKNGFLNNESFKQIAEKLPKRNADTVRAKAISIGLYEQKPQGEVWTEEEIEILKDMFLSSDSTYNDEIYKMLSRHSKSSIKNKASKLGFSKQRRENISNSLIGKQFGRWTVLEDLGSVNGCRMIHCRCECGTERDVNYSNLKSGISKSCGCYHDEVAKQNGENNRIVNSYDINSFDYGVGWTTNGYEFYFDKEDYKLVQKYCWHKHQDGYLRTCCDWYIDEHGVRHNEYIMLHQLLSSKYYNDETLDHINGLTYDNRKENLRPVKHIDNSKNLKLSITNKSGHKGVWKTPSGNWAAYITCNKKHYYLGTYKSYSDAVEIRENAEIELFKEYNRAKEYL